MPAGQGTTTAYSWGDSITTSDANYNSNIGQASSVGQYSANPWGFFDMHGNVWEWAADWQDTYPSGSVIDPLGSSNGSLRVHRGGSWLYAAAYLRSAFRGGNDPDFRDSGIGFRVALKQVD